MRVDRCFGLFVVLGVAFATFAAGESTMLVAAVVNNRDSSLSLGKVLNGSLGDMDVGWYDSMIWTGFPVTSTECMLATLYNNRNVFTDSIAYNPFTPGRIPRWQLVYGADFPQQSLISGAQTFVSGTVVFAGSMANPGIQIVGINVAKQTVLFDVNVDSYDGKQVTFDTALSSTFHVAVFTDAQVVVVPALVDGTAMIVAVDTVNTTIVNAADVVGDVLLAVDPVSQTAISSMGKRYNKDLVSVGEFHLASGLSLNSAVQPAVDPEAYTITAMASDGSGAAVLVEISTKTWTQVSATPWSSAQLPVSLHALTGCPATA